MPPKSKSKKQGRRDAAREKARIMRERQAAKDRRMKIILSSAVGLFVLAAGVAIALVFIFGNTPNALRGENAEALGDYSDGRPIVVGKDGVGQATAGAPEVTEYFSYSCHACADLDGNIQKELAEAIDQGKITINYQMVNAVDLAWRDAATAGALQIAQYDPEHFLQFHHKALEYFLEQFSAGSKVVIDNPEKALLQVKDIAKEIGVPEDVIEKFNVSAAQAYLELTTDAWRNAEVDGRDGSIGTPELVRDGKRLLAYDKDEQGKTSWKPTAEIIELLISDTFEADSPQ